MANRVSVEITANTSGYKNAIDEAKGANRQFQSSISDLDIQKLNREFRSAQKEAQGLALQMGKLKREGKVDSAEYRSMAKSFQEAKNKAAELLDIVDDTKKEIRTMASDTVAWDAMKEGINVARDGLSAITALTGENETLERVLKDLAQIQTVANAAISIGNALQKQSALMSGIRKVQEAALTRAIDMETAATGRATVAQRVFNAVAKANPYVLLASAILGVAAALGVYAAVTNKTNESTKALEENNKELSEQQKRLKDISDTYKSSYASGLAKTLVTYDKLKTAYSELTSNHEKTQWIEKNKDKFKDLGLAVNSVTDAENIFKNNTGAVVEAFKLRAQAAAEAARLESLYAQKIEATENAQGQAVKFTAGQRLQGSDADRYGLQEGKDYTHKNGQVGMFLTEEGAIKANAEAQKRAIQTATSDIDKEIQRSNDRLDTVVHQYASTLEQFGIKESSSSGSGKGGSNNQIKYIQGSLTDLEHTLSELKTKYKNGFLPNVSPEKYIETVKRLEDAISKKKIELGIELEPNDLQKIDQKKKELEQNQLNVKTRLSAEQYQAELKKLENEEHQVKVKLGFEVEESEFDKITRETQEKLNKITFDIPVDISAEPSELDKNKKELEQLTYIQQHIKLSEEDKAIVKEQIEKLNKDIEAEEITLGIKAPKTVIDQKQGNIDELTKKANDIYAAHGGMPDPNTDAYQQLLEIFKQIRDTQAEINAMQEPLAAAEEKHNKAVEKRTKTMNGVSKAIGNIGSAMASLADEEDKGTQAAAIIVQAIANVIAGYASASAEAGGTLGPWGWAAFSIAGLAQVAATIAQLKSLSSGYAAGGFIPGTSYSGDRLLARVNSGEAILNTQQQKRFMDIANGLYIPGAAGPQQVVVTGEIDGTKILLVQRNANKVRNKSGNAITF